MRYFITIATITIAAVLMFAANAQEINPPLSEILSAYRADLERVDRSNESAIKEKRKDWIERLSQKLAKASGKDPLFDKVAYELMALQFSNGNYSEAAKMLLLLNDRKSNILPKDTAVFMLAEIRLAEYEKTKEKQAFELAATGFSDGVKLITSEISKKNRNMIERLGFLQKAAKFALATNRYDDAINSYSLARTLIATSSAEARNELRKINAQGPSSFRDDWFLAEIFKIQIKAGRQAESLVLLTELLSVKDKQKLAADYVLEFANAFSDSPAKLAQLCQAISDKIPIDPNELKKINFWIASRYMDDKKYTEAILFLNKIVKDENFDFSKPEFDPRAVQSRTKILQMYAACLSQLGFFDDSQEILNKINQAKTTLQ